MASYEVKDLQYWDAKIREKAEEFGLDCYPQEFEVCDHLQMMSAMAYSGLPAHYPHWSYGKAYERQKTLYDYGVAGLPYEMVINTSPCLAYLMRENSLCLQVLTIAHVYGHNDFFKNNFTFRHTNAHLALGRFKAAADRVRSYVEDPSIGVERIEAILDAAHALSLHCGRNFAIRRLKGEEQRRWIAAARDQDSDEDYEERRDRADRSTLETRTPAEPEEDVLLFIRDHNPYLADWEKDLLTIVHEEAQYFIPQIETKIMNEGWASYWHHQIMNSLDLPQDVYLEFLVRHNQVIRPIPGQINPYHVGFRLFQDIRRRWDEPTSAEIEEFGPPNKSGLEKLFEVREVERDVSFLRRYLTERMALELNLFQYETVGDQMVVTRTSRGEGWRDVKETLLKQVGMGGVPVIRVVDADYHRARLLLLRHEHDGRDLDLDHAEKTMRYLRRLWGRGVVLETELDGQPKHLVYNDAGLTITSPT